MAVEQRSLLDALYCEEETEEDGESEITTNENSFNLKNNNHNLSLLWDDEEIQSLFVKERETCIPKLREKDSVSLSRERKEAVEWVLKIKTGHGFSPLTATLAVNYLDRFLSGSCFQKEKPWMMQLAAVTCLSLAAKVEETHVPLLLDLQVDDAKYVFDSKTIQRMELLVLSGLKWRMNPVTPLSFLDHIIRRLGLKSYIHWEFFSRSCENLILSVIPDPRIMHYLPSVLATATMLHVIHKVEPCNSVEYEDQLLGVLNISKEEVGDCYEVISDVLLSSTGTRNPLKREYCQVPSNSDDGSNDSMALSSSSSTHDQTILKKTRRIQEQQMRLPSLSRVVVGRPH